MKTRPHIVMQTRLHDTAVLTRSADLIAARMGSACSLKNVLGYSRVLIRVMKIILDLTLHNDCYARRREVLESPRLRRSVIERLGGAQALRIWRRRQAWNKARLAAMACGDYRVGSSRHVPPSQRPAARRNRSGGPVQTASLFETAPAKFRLPVLKNPEYVYRPRMRSISRATPQKRFPSVVLWPHELDGQYVPNFKSRAGFPSGGGYASDDAAPPRENSLRLPLCKVRASP